MEEAEIAAGDPIARRRDRTTNAGVDLLESCPACGSSELLTEPAVDEEGMPTGMTLVNCGSCGREHAELPPPELAPEAEPEMTEGSLLPGPDEGPRTPPARRHEGHPPTV